jgi:hypothetical protein
MKGLPHKRRTREHIIADLSVNHVERQILLCGFTCQRIVQDYGIDLEITPFSRKGDVEEGKVLVQLKASDRLRLRPGQATFSYRIDRSDLVHWLAQPMPVILAIYDARKNAAYWLYVQSYFRKRTDFNLFAAGKTITVQVETANVVAPAAVRKFARFLKRVLEQTREVVHDEENVDPVR